MLEVILEDDGTPFTRAKIVEIVKKGRAPDRGRDRERLRVGARAGGKPALELLRDPAKGIEFQIASQALFPAVMESTGGSRARSMTLDGRALVHRRRGLRATADTRELERKSADLRSRWAAERIDVAASRPRRRAAATDDFATFDFPGPCSGSRDRSSLPDQTRRSGSDVGELAQSVAGTAVMMLLFGLTACGTTILAGARRRDAAEAPRLARAARRDPRRQVRFTFVGLLQLVVMFAFGALVFRMPVLAIPGHRSS